MVQDGTGWYRMAQDGTGWYRMVQDGTGWHRMAQDGTGWYRMVRDGPGRDVYACARSRTPFVEKTVVMCTHARVRMPFSEALKATVCTHARVHGRRLLKKRS